MDATSFDRLIRRFPPAPSRRGVLTGLASGLLTVLPLGPGSGEDAAARKKRKKKKKKKGCSPNCIDRACGNDGCGGSCGACGAGQVCESGTCCTPQLPAATCAGRCGTWPNNCGQPVACATCPGGQTCSINGSCATACPPDCPAGCFCAEPNAEGAQHCVALEPCTTQECTSTAECPPGAQCSDCGFATFRCVTLCAAG